MMLLSAFLLNLALHHLRLIKQRWQKIITALTQVPTSDETDFTSHIYLLEGC